MRFLVDTAATTVLNLKSSSGGHSKEVQITSWSDTAATSAREVSISDLAIGSHHLRDLRLPGIDLNPIGKACGGTIDTILGVDLLDKLRMTIDLKRQVALLEGAPRDKQAAFDEMKAAMNDCSLAFEQGDVKALHECFDPEIVLYTPDAEYRGREQVIQYLSDRYFKYVPDLIYSVRPHDVQMFGNALWYSYDYSMDAQDIHKSGHGMAICRNVDGHWRMLNMHNSLLEPQAAAVR